MDKLTINSGSGYKLSINNVEQDKIELGVDSILPPVVCGDVTSEQLAAALAAIELTPGPQGPAGPQGEQGPAGTPADPAALDALTDRVDAIYTTEITPSLKNATYANGILHWTGGEILAGSGVLGSGLIVDGIHTVSLTIPSNDSMIAVYAGAAEDFSEVGSSVPHGAAIMNSRLYLCIEGTLAGDYPVSVGDSVTVEMTDTTVSAIINGVRHDATLVSTPLPSNIKTHAGIFVAPGGSSVPDLHVEFVGNIATGLLPEETAARIAADAALQEQIDDVQTLAQVNQLNIGTKADQLDLETLQTTVTSQGLTLAQKADQTALDALATVVSGKATPADITAAIAALVDGAPDALNTLSEIATALAGEQAQIADLLSALALRVRADAVQSLTLAQQLQARQNIGAEAVGVAAGLVAAITPASIGAATAVQGAKADTALQSGDVAPVALSGQYSDLAGLPTIPGLSSSTPASPTTSGTAGTATTAARGDHAHPLPTAAQITAAVLTGLATGSATAIAAADTILQALEKLQAQITGLAAVASSGSYTDLTNKPTIISIQQLTKAQYDALTTAQKNDASILYVIVG